MEQILLKKIEIYFKILTLISEKLQEFNYANKQGRTSSLRVLKHPKKIGKLINSEVQETAIRSV